MLRPLASQLLFGDPLRCITGGRTEAEARPAYERVGPGLPGPSRQYGTSRYCAIFMYTNDHTHGRTPRSAGWLIWLPALRSAPEVPPCGNLASRLP
jgi:hypothetical protein